MAKDPKYKFIKPLYRLQGKEEITGLFDNPDEIRRIRHQGHYGKINGIDVQVIFSKKTSCKLCAKTQAGLGKAHKRALDILTGQV